MYLDYFKMGRSSIRLFLTVFIFVVCQVTLNATDFFLSYWTNAEIENGRETSSSTYLGRSTYIYIYTGLISFAIATSLLRSVFFLNYTSRIGINVHNSMFSSLVRAKLKFFDENPSGRVMNRFTKDLGSMDEVLPPTMLEMLTILAQLLGVVVIVVISNYYMAPLAFVIMALLWVVRGYYVNTTRAIKRVEGITKSPIFTHSAATFTGLTTIRALQAEQILIDQFDALQDIHTSSWFLFFSSARAFGVCCEILSTIFLTVVSVSFLLMQDTAQIGNVGLAISAALTLSGELQYGLRQSTEVENLMTSVERNLEYADLPSEVPLDSKADKKPENGWPKDGNIQFQNVSLSYHDTSDSDTDKEATGNLVLKQLTFEIRARQKIGIVGRSGSGKSSIIQALFRLTEPQPDGRIIIDGVNIGEIGLHDLRKAISIIPQEPILFSGTIRYNLDPFGEFPDDELWAVLADFELKKVVPALDFKVAEGGSNYSVGQRQLICLARAMLRRNNIIVLDEATANTDPETDMLIQKAIREKFAGCTIVTVAHRLHSVIDCDKIMVLDNGYLKEYGSPHDLLQKDDGVFRGMVEQLGKANTELLRKTAEKVYYQTRLSS